MKKIAGVLFVFLIAMPLSRAQEDASALESKVDQLRGEVRQLTEVLARMIEVEQQSRPAPEPARKADAWELKSGDVTMKFGVVAQFDTRVFSHGSPGDSGFTWRRVRPDIHGQLPNNLTYRVQGDFAGSNAKLVEGWLDWQSCKWSSLRFGQFKEPFSLEAMQIVGNLDFLERSMIVTAFAPLFDTGAALSANLLDGRLSSQVGVFNGRGANIENNNDDMDVAGRLVFQALEHVFIGASITHGEQDEDLKDISYRSAGRVPFFKYAPEAKTDGNRDRYGADVEWYCGPASVKAEWLKSRQENVFIGTTNDTASFDGYYVMGSYMLTGEDKLRNRAMTDVSTRNGTFGAWEAVLRFDEFNANSSLFDTGLATGADRAQAATVGLNWYPNANVRVMGNVVHVKYSDTIIANGRKADDEDVALLRLQYSL